MYSGAYKLSQPNCLSIFINPKFVKKIFREYSEDILLKEFYGQLNQLSPNYQVVGKYQSFLNACFDQMVSCAKAQKECRDDDINHGQADECDHDLKVIEACANEAICITKQFFEMERVIPDLLGGRDPWPPQPFPY